MFMGGEPMNKQIIKVSDMQRFAAECFDRPEESEKATRILKGILDARSPRIIVAILSEPSSGFIGNKPPLSSVTLLTLRDIKPGRLSM